MPIHARKQIRDRAAVLLTGLPSTAARVFKTRTIPLKSEQLPAWCVYTLQDTRGDDNTIGDRAIERDVQLVLQGVASVTDNLDDVLDAIAAEAEAAMGADPTLGIGCKGSMLLSTVIVPKHEAETTTGSIALTYSISYRARPRDPYTLIP